MEQWMTEKSTLKKTNLALSAEGIESHKNPNQFQIKH